MDLPFSCCYENCSKAFKRRDRLEIHLRTHTGERPYACDVVGCHRSYARSQHLSRHIERVHSLNVKSQQRTICPHCQEEFANSFCLKKHINSFHSSTHVKVYKCSQEGCNQNFHKKQQLLVHRLQHGEQLIGALKCYSCPHENCDKQFVFPGRLKRHMKIHQGYPCDVDGCEEMLPNWSMLRKHKATAHCPAFTCNTCGVVFKTKSNLTQHKSIHMSGFQNFQCTWEGCDRTFQYQKNLRQHIRSFHKRELVFQKNPKPKKPRKKISLAARIFDLDDRGKEVKASRRCKSKSHEHAEISSGKYEKEMPSELNSSPSHCEDFDLITSLSNGSGLEILSNVAGDPYSSSLASGKEDVIHPAGQV